MFNSEDRRIPSTEVRARTWPFALMLVAATGLSYLNGVAAPFIFDDQKWIVEDPQVRDLASDWRSLDAANRPVVLLTLALNYNLGFLDVRGYHLFNIIIHALASLLLFGVVRRTIELHCRRRGVQVPAASLAFTVALLWLVHPLQTESVTYVIQRCESMMGLFFLVCLYCVIRGAQSGRSWPWYLASLAACLLGLGCKEVMATAPAVILLYDRVFLSASWRDVLRRRGWLYSALFGAGVVMVLLMWPTIAGHGDASLGLSGSNLTPWMYLQSQPGVLVHYLRLAFWPRPLCLDYAWPPARSPAEIIPPAVAVLTLLLGSLVALRFRPWVGFLGLSCFFVLAPTSSIIPIKDLAVEHRMYVPLAALVVVAVLCWFGLTQRVVHDPAARRLARLGPAALPVLLLTGLTLQRNADYCDPLRMWSKVVEVAPHNARGHFSLGATYNLRGDARRARACFERAIALDPGYARAHGNLGVLLVRQGEMERGEEHLRRALELSPAYVTAIINLGNLLVRQQDWRGALTQYRQAVQLEPYNTRASQNMAVVLLNLGQPRAAVAALRESLRLNPHSNDVRLHLAWVLATCEDATVRDGAEALRLATEARRQVGDDCRVLEVVAAACAEAGQFEAAVAAAQLGLRLAKTEGRGADLQAFERRLNQYRSGTPAREAVARSSRGTIDDQPDRE